jgi:adenylyltransferase/sulfurtransferase
MGGIDADWEVSVHDVKRMLDAGEDFVFIDVRQPEEHAIARIQSAWHIPIGDLPGRIDSIRDEAGSRPIIAHCHHGGRSLAAASILRDAGLRQAKSMSGGIEEWSCRIDPGVPRY